MLPSAYLRVYRPIDAFEVEERARWERYIVSDWGLGLLRPIYRHESTALEGRVGLLAPADDGRAEVRFVERRAYVCPQQTRLRVLASLVSLRETAPQEMADALVLDVETRRAARELARLRRRHPSAVPTIQQAAWHVPVGWFVLFEDEERRLVPRPDGGSRLYYWTSMELARGRASAALRALRRAGLGSMAESVREMSRWLSSFPPRSAVELDYASVSSLFTWDELDDDHSARDIQEALRALRGAGGEPRARERYRSVVSRWTEARNRETLN